MKTNLQGLLEQAGTAAKRGDKMYGGMYAFVLMELGDHIRGLLRGDYTSAEFADHYCLDLSDKAPWAQSKG